MGAAQLLTVLIACSMATALTLQVSAQFPPVLRGGEDYTALYFFDSTVSGNYTLDGDFTPDAEGFNLSLNGEHCELAQRFACTAAMSPGRNWLNLTLVVPPNIAPGDYGYSFAVRWEENVSPPLPSPAPSYRPSRDVYGSSGMYRPAYVHIPEPPPVINETEYEPPLPPVVNETLYDPPKPPPIWVPPPEPLKPVPPHTIGFPPVTGSVVEYVHSPDYVRLLVGGMLLFGVMGSLVWYFTRRH